MSAPVEIFLYKGTEVFDFFCVLKTDVTHFMKFSDPYILADDLKWLAVAKTQEQKQFNLEAISNWIHTNELSEALDKCYKLKFRGKIY